jgi:DivIVA domain
MRRKKGSEDAPATGDARITPEEVQQVEFRLAFRGYNERDVDAFLDRITEGLSSYREELEAAVGLGLPLAAAAASTGDADAILAGARAEADRSSGAPRSRRRGSGPPVQARATPVARWPRS